jgi:DNA polymerase III subunit alpha
MGFPDYFLLVQDILSWARDNKILTGPGRGSSVGALVTYVLGITHIDPIKYKLVFERFLNPERISMPDIDLDISETQRDDLIQYIKTTYGSECVANIGTFGTMKAKGAIRDITRTLGYDYEIGDNLARLVLEPVAGKVQDLNICYEKVPELQKARINNGPEQEILTWAEKFENRIDLQEFMLVVF